MAKKYISDSFVKTGGTSLQFLKADGSISEGGGGLAPISIATSTNATANNLYIFTANLTLTLPASPTIGDRIGISNRSDVLTCVIARNGKNIAGIAEDMTVDVLNIGFELVYANTTQGWVLQ
jgi:hypothetical protein